MSAAPQQAAPVDGQAAAWPMLRAMAGVGLLCGFLIASVFIGTGPAIERNRAQALQRAIFEVLPAARSSATFGWQDDGRFERLAAEEKSAGPVVHAGFDEAQQLVGFAIEAAGMGYQDVIRVLYGYAPQESAIVGLRVLESRETPGLGDRIETDADFRANFSRLDVSLGEGEEHLANPIEAVKHGEKQAPWQVDGITGATISSQAIARILHESAARWVPRITRTLDRFGEE